MNSSFNEIFNPDGEIRENYQHIYQIWEQFSSKEKKQKLTYSKELYHDDYPLDLFPRILSKNEYSILKAGVQQRAETILKLLHSFYNGCNSWKKVIPEEVMNQIYNRNHQYDYRSKLNPKSISFPYGPDIIKDRKGNWRILEDNIGNVGGIGDLISNHKILFKLVPQYKNVLKEHNIPKDFFMELSSHFHKKANEKKGIPLLFLNSFQREDDHETRRLAKLFRDNGIFVLSASDKRSKILLERNKIYYQPLNQKKIKVGYLILKNGPEILDYYYFRNSLKFSLKEDFNINNQSRIDLENLYKLLCLKPIANCFQSSILGNHINTNFTPGTDFCADKTLGVYMDELINLYQKTSPIISSLPSHSFLYRSHLGKWCLNKRMLNYIFLNKDKYVIKQADKEAGKHVWVGIKQTKKSFNKIKDAIIKNPELYIYQKYEPLSIIEDKIVDLRIHAHVDCDKIIISNTPWGRANLIKGNGKVNISTGGMASPVFVQ